MQRRSHNRISIHQETKFYSGLKVNFGVITDISESGLFILTKIDFPMNINFDLLIPSDYEIISIPVNISRLARLHGECHGIGVSVVDPPLNYLEYVGNLRASMEMLD